MGFFSDVGEGIADFGESVWDFGGDVVSGVGDFLTGNDKTREAARQQKLALDSAQAFQEQQFQRAQDLQQPFLEQTSPSFTRLQDLAMMQAGQQGQQIPVQTQGFDPSTFNISEDAGIQFAQEQAQKALERRAAAGGSLGGGATLAELQRQAIGLGGQQANQAFDRFLRGNALQAQTQGQRFGELSSSRGQQFGEQQQGFQNLSQIGMLAPQIATGLGNQAIGQGARLADLATQRGNVDASALMARGAANRQLLGDVLGLGGQLAGGLM